MLKKYYSNCCNIEIDKISYLINQYEAETGEKPNYLIMNQDTVNLYKCSIKHLSIFLNSNNSETMFGIDVAICNKLKFGYVEVV